MKKPICLVLLLAIVLPLSVFAQSSFNVLMQGQRGEEIRDLQEILKQDPSIYPEGLTTGYFGPLTKRAVERLQRKFNLPVTGVFDQKTASIIFPCSDVKLTVVSPNGGEDWDRKEVHEIKWQLSRAINIESEPAAEKSSAIDIVNRAFWPKGRIDLINSNGALVKHIASVNLAYQSYNWKISSDIPNGSDYKIRIYYGFKPLVCFKAPCPEKIPVWQCPKLADESDGTFAISGEITPPPANKVKEAITIVERVIKDLNKLLEILQSLL